MRNWLWFVAALAGALVLAIIGTTPQPPRSADAPPGQFSAARAMVDVRAIARAPHPTGTAENAQVRAYIAARMRAHGFTVTEQRAPLDDYSSKRLGNWTGEDETATQLVNVIGYRAGTDSNAPAVALMAHHDTVGGSPGAADDTAGVAAILETARVIGAGPPLRRDVYLIMTDAEEAGLTGARAFFSDNPAADRIGAIINLEARGGGGRTTLFQTSSANGEVIKRYAAAVKRPGGSSLATFVYEVLPNDTDLTPALERNYAAYNLSFIGRPGLYHSPKATPAALDQGALQDMGDQTLALALALADAEALPSPAPDRTFFDFVGLFLIHYSTAISWALLAITAALHVVCLRANPPGKWWRGLAAGAGVMLGGGALLYLANALSGGGSASSEYYDRLAAIPLLEAQALLLCVAALAVTLPLWAGRGGSILGLVIALAMQVAAPTTAFLVVWPLLLAGIIGVSVRYLPGTTGNVVRAVLAAAALGMVLQFGHQFMQGIGADLPSVVALLAALAIPVLGPLTPQVAPRRAFMVAGLCLLAGLAIAAVVRFDPVADTVPVYASDKPG